MFTFGFETPSLAQSSKYIQAFDRLDKINRYRPEQSAKHVANQDILAGRVLDRTNRVVGEVRDVILNRNGGIAMLDVNFNRINLGVDSLMVDYNQFDIRPATNGYKMGRTDDQVTAMLPSLLAATETASGNNADIFSLKKMIGQKVYSRSGKKLGKVEKVLFDASGSRAELLFISMEQRSIRGKKIAIPFAGPSYNSKKINVRNDFADAMIAYAKSK